MLIQSSLNKELINEKKVVRYVGSKKTKLNGLYANGRQRFYCKECRHSFSIHNKGVKRSNEFIWFKEWLCEGYTVSQLSRISKKSERKIRLIIDYWLNNSPQFSYDNLAKTRIFSI